MAMLPVQAPLEQGSVQEIRPRLAGGSSRALAGRSDERLVSIAKEGDERAFEVLYERHAPAIQRYCRSLLRSPQEAEDVKQEVFVLAISALRRGARPEAFRPWLYRVAHNACMSHLRIRRPVLVADNGVLVGPAAAAEPVQHHREELRQLLDDIGKLPDVQRGALLLREMDGFSYEQVGEVLGLPLSTVRASIFRARRTLQGLAAARNADCDIIQSELSELADRRGRRGRHITSHLTVCSNCRDFRDGLRRRPTVLGGVAPVSPAGPGGLLLALKGKLLGGAAVSGGTGTAVATATGGAGAAEIAPGAAPSIAPPPSAGVEADHVIQQGRRDAALTPRHSATPAAHAAAAVSARATTRRGATGLTVSASDLLRAGRPVGDRSRRIVPSASASHAHARVKAPAKRSVAPSATPRGGVPVTTPVAPAGAAAEEPNGTVIASEHDGAERAHEHEGAERPATPGRDGDEQRGSSGADDSHGSTSGGRESKGSGSKGPGSERAEEPADRPASGDVGRDAKQSSGPGPAAGGDTPRPPAPSRSGDSSGGPVPRAQSVGSGPPDAADTPAPPATPDTPAPAPHPTPTH